MCPLVGRRVVSRGSSRRQCRQDPCTHQQDPRVRRHDPRIRLRGATPLDLKVDLLCSLFWPWHLSAFPGRHGLASALLGPSGCRRRHCCNCVSAGVAGGSIAGVIQGRRLAASVHHNKYRNWSCCFRRYKEYRIQDYNSWFVEQKMNAQEGALNEHKEYGKSASKNTTSASMNMR